MDDVGPVIAENIIAYFANPHNQEVLEHLAEVGIQFGIRPVRLRPQRGISGGDEYRGEWCFPYRLS